MALNGEEAGPLSRKGRNLTYSAKLSLKSGWSFTMFVVMGLRLMSAPPTAVPPEVTDFVERMDDDVGAVGQRPHQGRRGAGGVDDEGDAPFVGQVGDRLDVAERLLGIARGFHVQETGVFIDLGRPVPDLIGFADPSEFDRPAPWLCGG